MLFPLPSIFFLFSVLSGSFSTFKAEDNYLLEGISLIRFYFSPLLECLIFLEFFFFCNL